ncbi:MAG: alpha/beta hydrolase [Gallicola sp.]|nr:alpha/beta hydrolase [Gallicola sp.]
MRIVEKYLTEDKKVKIKGYLFEAEKDHISKKPWTPEKRPAVLILPGGYYIYCSQREGDPAALRFSQKGYQAFILEYSCGKVSDYPRPLLEVAEALSFIRENAEEFLVDTEKISLMGFSAGGHLALTYGSIYFREDFQEISGKSEVQLKISNIIAAYPVANLGALYKRAKESANEKGLENEISVGDMFVNYEERRDPIKILDKKMPRTFIFTSLEDKLIPAEDTVEYVRQAVKKGLDIEFHLFNKGNHGLSTADDLSNFGRDYPKRVGVWMDMAFSWLEEK